MNTILISEKYIKQNSNINDNVFGSWLLPAIREAQEMYLEPIIGKCLYEKIVYLVNEKIIEGDAFIDYKVLLDDYIQPFLLYQVLANIIPIINVKLANLGSVTTNDEHTTNLTQGESDLIQNYYQIRADFYIKRLQKYLTENKVLYPELAECDCGANLNLKSASNGVGVWLGGLRGRKSTNDGNCSCNGSSSPSPCGDYQSGFTDGVAFQKGKLDDIVVSTNGIYTREDGFFKVEVDVHSTGHTDEELQEAYDSGHTDGYIEGSEDGYADGYGDGFDSGHTDGMQDQKSLLSSLIITQNGNYEREDGYSAITVNVSGQQATLTTTAITENGEYFPPQNYDGFSSFEVNVQTGETINNQSKSVSVTANTSVTVTYDSGYTGLESVSINVSVPQSGHTDAEMEEAYESGKTDGYNEAKEDDDALTFEILTAGTVQFKTGSNHRGFYYKKNEGEWTRVSDSTTVEIQVVSGDLVKFKGNYFAANLTFSGTTAYFNVYGNYGSLGVLGGLGNPTFGGLNVVDASGLIIPSGQYRYSALFSGCTSLKYPPKLPNVTIDGQFLNMFADCTSLVYAPELPETNLSTWDGCYEGMFKNCTSLTSAPELPATSIGPNAYDYMFMGCTNLRYIKCLQESSPDNNYWVDGVPSDGIFIKSANQTHFPTGKDGIPSGWTVIDAQ